MNGQNNESFLEHYGMPKRSGRYPYGSGENPYQHGADFAGRVQELRKEGMSDVDIAKAVGLKSTTELRAQYSSSIAERRAYEVARARSLKSDGYNPSEIGRIMGKNESSVRSLLNQETETRMSVAKRTVNFLKKQVEEKGMIDVGDGVERELGISREKMAVALEALKSEGYEVYKNRISQVTNPGKRTTTKILCPPGTEYKKIYNHDDVKTITDYKARVKENGDDVYEQGFVYPRSLDSKRVAIRYAEDGGKDKDGLVEIRRGVEDVSMGEKHYSQVRILVDGTHYIKGMAVYSDDLPDGVDVLFNTNKSSSVSKMDVLKPISKDPDNPFGALIKEHGGQTYYTDSNGERKLSVVNKTRDEGDWNEWSDSLPSQFLSKQPIKLIRKQLNQSLDDRQAEFDELMSLTNPTVKNEMLNSFADDCDAASVHLQAAALPRQKYQVILPLTSIKDNEVYAPNYEDGETIALVRFPHGGTFEIPILKVNNKNQEGLKLMGPNALDAVGINSNVAARLSGADFDGDTVMAIPCNSSRSDIKITSTPPLKGLETFDAKLQYKIPEGNPNNVKTLSKGATQTQMGVISNLITDMTIKGATADELERAVKHSMVVIDANKHGLDYKQSEVDNGIASLKKKYQGRIDEQGNYREGASTLISMAKSEVRVPKRVGSPHIDKETGEVSYKEVIEEYVDKSGKTRIRTTESTKMAEAKDARSLSSGYPQEEEYARYANALKAMANEARKEALRAGRIKLNPAAKEKYSYEVASLMAKLNIAALNAPREREAQRIANTIVDAKKEANPDLNKKEIQKISQQALVSARAKVGAKRTPIIINDKEWEAIQAGAISDTNLRAIIANTDKDNLRQRATPKYSTQISPSKQARIDALKASGYTNAQIASAIGVSVSTVNKYTN